MPTFVDIEYNTLDTRSQRILSFFSSCTPILRRQAYNRLEKFMQIALERYNTQYNL